MSVHRKLKPTGAERVVWGDAQQDYFPVVDTPWGAMGSLICWESYMPLARVALYEKGVSLYISPNTNDNEEWQATIRHIAIEGHCYFINSDMFFTRDTYPADLHCPEEIARLPEIVCRGGSCIVDPYGHYVTQPVWDKEAIIPGRPGAGPGPRQPHGVRRLRALLPPGCARAAGTRIKARTAMPAVLGHPPGGVAFFAKKAGARARFLSSTRPCTGLSVSGWVQLYFFTIWAISSQFCSISSTRRSWVRVRSRFCPGRWVLK